jgi:hypothetical protein
VDDNVEEAVLDDGALDGKEASDEWINEINLEDLADDVGNA